MFRAGEDCNGGMTPPIGARRLPSHLHMRMCTCAFTCARVPRVPIELRLILSCFQGNSRCFASSGPCRPTSFPGGRYEDERACVRRGFRLVGALLPL